MEKGGVALYGEEDGLLQFAACRIFAHATRRRVGQTLLHLHAQRRARRRDQRHHGNKACRHLLLGEGRQGEMEPSRARQRRTEHRLRGRRVLVQPRRSGDVLDPMRHRPQLSALCTNHEVEPIGRRVGKSLGGEDLERHALQLCTSRHLTRRPMALLLFGHAGRQGRTRHLAHPTLGRQRIRWC